MTLRAIVVDDEPLGRRGIVSRLEGSSVAVVAECANGRDAIEAIRRLHPDLLFLDVEMPGMDGLEVAAELGDEEQPHTIFVTAYERYAVRAFEVHALDYLLKPIDDARFAEALERAVSALARDRDGDIGRRVRAVVGDIREHRGGTAGKASERYVVRADGKLVFLRHAEIDWIEAEGDYVRIHAGPRSWLVRQTMKGVEADLGTRRFIRIHRSTIVNADKILELRSFDNGDYAVSMRDGTELRLSRTFRDTVEKLVHPRRG